MLIIYLSNKGGKVGVCEPFGNLIIKQALKGGIDNYNCTFKCYLWSISFDISQRPPQIRFIYPGFDWRPLDFLIL